MSNHTKFAITQFNSPVDRDIQALERSAEENRAMANTAFSAGILTAFISSALNTRGMDGQVGITNLKRKSWLGCFAIAICGGIGLVSYLRAFCDGRTATLLQKYRVADSGSHQIDFVESGKGATRSSSAIETVGT